MPRQITVTTHLEGLPHVAGISDLKLTEGAPGPVLYGASRLDGGLFALDVSVRTAPVLLDQISYTPDSGTLGVQSLALGHVQGSDVLLSAGRYDDAAAPLALSADGTFGDHAVSALPSSLLGSWSETALISANAVTTVFASQRTLDGLQVFTLGADLSLTHRGHLPDTGASTLRDVTALAAAERDGRGYLFAASGLEDGLSSFVLDDSGSPVLADSLSAQDGLPVNAPTSLTTLTMGDDLYVVLGSAGTGSLSVFSAASDGTLALTDHRLDSLDTRFDGVQALANATADGRSFIAAGGADDGLSIFELAGDGSLHHIASIADTQDTTLRNVEALAADLSNGNLRVFAAGSEPGLTEVSFDLGPLGQHLVGTQGQDLLQGGPLDDLIVGRGGTDTLDGGAGDDRLVDGDATDFLHGGAGRDVFALSSDGELDVILDFENDHDRIDLSALVGANGMGDLNITALEIGLLLRVSDDTVWLATEGLTSQQIGPEDFLF